MFEQQLPSIEELYFESCESLECLSLNIFPKLQTLFIRNCQMLDMSLNNERPVPKLTMKHLYLMNFPRLVTLPRWVACAAGTLETFVINDVPNLQMDPECIITMTHLKRLHIAGCHQPFSLPCDMCCLTALKYFHIADCPELYFKNVSSNFVSTRIKSIFI